MSRRNLDAVGIANAKPLLGNGRDIADSVLVIQEVALHFEVGAIADFDDVAVAQRID